MKSNKTKFMDLGDIDVYFFDYIIESPVGQIYTFKNPLELMHFLKSYNEINNGYASIGEKYKNLSNRKKTQILMKI